MTRYSRRRADGVVEYHANEESLARSRWRETRRSHRFYGFVLGVIGGGLFAYIGMQGTMASDWPRWVRFACVVAVAGIAGLIISRLFTLLLALVRWLVFAAVAFLVMDLIWQAV